MGALILSLYLMIYFKILNDVFVSCQDQTNAQPKKRKGTLVISDVTATDMTVKCKLQANGFNCSDADTYEKYYYDIKMKDCLEAEMGIQCIYNFNMFKDRHKCHEACQDDGEIPIKATLGPAVFCRLQPDFGICDNYYPSYYFDLTSRQCKGFSFSGCGGNQNRFKTFQECARTCTKVVEYVNCTK